MFSTERGNTRRQNDKLNLWTRAVKHVKKKTSKYAHGIMTKKFPP